MIFEADSEFDYRLGIKLSKICVYNYPEITPPQGSNVVVNVHDIIINRHTSPHYTPTNI